MLDIEARLAEVTRQARKARRLLCRTSGYRRAKRLSRAGDERRAGRSLAWKMAGSLACAIETFKGQRPELRRAAKLTAADLRWEGRTPVTLER